MTDTAVDLQTVLADRDALRATLAEVGDQLNELTAERDELQRQVEALVAGQRPIREQAEGFQQDAASYRQQWSEEKARADELARKLDIARARVREAVNELGG